MLIPDQQLIRKHSYLIIRYHAVLALTPLRLQTSEFMPKGGARGQNLGHLRIFNSEVLLFSSPEPKAHGELIVYHGQSIRRLCVCQSGHTLNINIPETSGLIATKFYPKHHWGGGKAALGFEHDRIGTLVSMAKDSSHRVIMGKT